MAKFLTKPEEIEAEQFKGGIETGGYKIPKGVCYCNNANDPETLRHRFHVHTHRGFALLEEGDWVVKDRTGDRYHVELDSYVKNYLELFEPATPTIEMDLAGAMFTRSCVEVLNQKIAELPVRPDYVHVLIKNLWNQKGNAWDVLPEVDEPAFTVLGRDQLCQATVVHWIQRAMAANVSDEKIGKARERLQEIINFQSAHPERVKVPD